LAFFFGELSFFFYFIFLLKGLFFLFKSWSGLYLYGLSGILEFILIVLLCCILLIVEFFTLLEVGCVRTECVWIQ
jgi:hypothetical protein